MFSFDTAAARFIAAMTLAVAATQAHAAPAQPAQPSADPADARAPAPAVHYRSALGSYRKLTDQPLGDWRALNDQVRQIGGWRAYAREAASPDEAGAHAPAAGKAPASSPLPASPSSPASSAGHGGHRQQ